MKEKSLLIQKKVLFTLLVFTCLSCTPKENELLVKGLDSYDNEQYRTAITYFNEALESEPGNAELYFYRGRTKMQLDSCKEAIDDYSRAIILDKTQIGLFH